jgi:hypothetical protein
MQGALLPGSEGAKMGVKVRSEATLVKNFFCVAILEINNLENST